MWTNEYKAPWHIEMDEFYQNDKKTKVDYLHSLGAKYDFKNDLVLEAAFGQAQGYIDQYFAKASYKFDVAGTPLTTSYQFYGTRDKVSNGGVNDIYDGTAWLQALTFGYKVADVLDLRLEGTWVKADGQQGYFLQRMTPTYASSNGRLDIWWDNRSDFNANGEKAVFFGAMYDMKNWNMPGWAFGASYVYAWDAKPGECPRLMRTTTRINAWKSPPIAWMPCTPFRKDALRARCSNSTLRNTTTTPISQAGAAVTATSSRMNAT